MKKLILPLALFCIAILGACKKPAPSPGSPKQEEIRVAYAPVVLNAPLFLAQDRGIFQANNLKVDAKVFTSANDMINAIVADQVDAVTGVSLVPVLHLAAEAPGKIRVILHSRMVEDQVYDGLVVKNDSPIQKLEDLRAHKVGIYPGTTALNLMKAFLKTKGIDPAAVNFVPLPPASHVSALQSGAIDALLAYEPTLTTLLQQPGFRRIHGSIFVAMLSPSPISSTVIARRFEREHPSASVGFVKALDQAIQGVRSDPTAARNAITAHTKLPAEVGSHVNLIADTLSTETDVANLQSFIDLLVQMGELQKTVSAKDLLAPTQ